MSQYAVLNFEDKITDTNVGAADSTIKGLKGRYEGTKQPKGIKSVFLSRNSVADFRCVNAAPIAFTTDGARIAEIRTACVAAKKIYLVMHGDPRTTNVCYTNAVPSTAGVIQLCTATQLAAFLATVLVGRKDEYRLALVMCYGARCQNYQSANVNHQGMIPQAELVTSFAYRLFYSLVHDHDIHASMTAVTGKIAHDSTTGAAMVEVEEMIDLNMEFSEASRAKIMSMKGAVGGELLPLDQQDDTYKANATAWKQSAEGAAALLRATNAQAAKNQVANNLPPERGGGSMRKYGKIEYRLKGGALIIASRYGDSVTGLLPGTVLYKGPLLAAG